jgi:SAM-dependent methyltransferase
VLPIILTDSDVFAKVRRFLMASHYDEAAVCERLKLTDAADYLTLRPNPASPYTIRDSLDALVRLFLIGEIVEQSQLEHNIPAAMIEALAALGVIARYPGRSMDWYATVGLYPAYGLYIVSDRWTSPEASPIQGAADVVYPAITVNTAQFLEALPQEPCESFLDLCAGTGIAALVAASRYARHAWSADITEAAAHCAEFNRRLNGVENLTVVRGDLYDAVSDKTFDRIVANPPHMPSLKRAELWADGGQLGDHITRRIIEGLPKYLVPGGRFYCVTAGPDRKGEGFEGRMRVWLGEHAPQFDIFLFERRLFDPAQIAHQQAARTRGGLAEVDLWKELFDQNEVEHIFYGPFVVQKKATAGEPVTVRRRKGSRLGSSEIEWMRAWETAAAHPEMLRRLLDSRPVAARGLELHVVHRMHDGKLAPQRFTLQTEYPFEVECSIQPWTAYLIGRCDGRTTGRQLLQFLRENQFLAADEPEDQFADYLRDMVSGGFLEVEGFRLPAP